MKDKLLTGEFSAIKQLAKKGGNVQIKISKMPVERQIALLCTIENEIDVLTTIRESIPRT